MEGRDPRQQAHWAGTPEAREQEKQEKQKARQRYRELWGIDPA